MNIQWYPGHMAKSARLIEENLKAADLALYVLDARIPAASLNPDLDALTKNKAVIYVLNKADLADPKATEGWIKALSRGEGRAAVALNGRVANSARDLPAACRKLAAEKLRKYANKGVNYVLKATVIGIPNCGKSTLINNLAGTAAAKTGNRPGVTRGKQWIKLNDYFELLDTPGVLWGNIRDKDAATRLAFCGCIKDEILDAPELAAELLSALLRVRGGDFLRRYGVAEDGRADAPSPFDAIARKRGCIGRGGIIDAPRAAALILDDFRGGRLGRITLEPPPDGG